MSLNLIALSSAEIIVAFILLGTALYLVLRITVRKDEFWPGIMLLCIAAMMMLVHAVGITSDNLSFKLFFENLQLTSFLLLVAVWSLFIIAYAGYSTWNKPTIIGSLAALPIMGVILIFTNDFHHLVWTSIELNSYNPYFPLDTVRGPGALLIFSLIYLYGVCATIALIRKLVATRHIYQIQSICLIVIGFVILETGLFDFLRLGRLLNTAVYPTLWAVAISSLVIVRVIPMLQIKEIRPIVREAIVAEMQDLIIVLDESDRVVDLNLAAQQLFEQTIMDTYGKPLTQLLPELSKHLKFTHRKNSKKEVALKYNGLSRIYDISVSPLTDIKGEAKGTILVLRDITERKQMEQSLRESEERYRILIENAEQIIAVIQGGIIRFTNSKLEKVYGYTMEEVNAICFDNMVHLDDRELVVYRRDQRLIGKPLSDNYTFRVITKDGRVIWVNRYVAEILWEGNPAVLVFDSDITERKEAELELMVRAQLLDSGYDAIYMHDLDGNIIYANEASYKMRGYTKEELVGNNLYRIAKPEQFRHIDYRIKQTIETGSCSFETNYYRKDGSTVPVEVHSRLIEIDGNKLIISIARDISERKKTEQELIMRAQLLDSASDAIYMHDLQGNIIYANEAVCALRGYTKEEHIGTNLFDLAKPEQLKKVDERVKSISEDGTNSFETLYYCKDGSTVPVEVHSRLIEIDGNKLIISIARDIRERKKTEDELKLRAQLLDNAHDAIAVRDLSGNYVYVNEMAYDSLGYSIEEFLTMNIWDILAPEYRDKAEDIIGQTLAKGEHEYEMVLCRKDGSQIHVETRARLVELFGKQLIISVSRDITEREKIMQALRESEEKTRIAFDTVAEGITVTDLKANITQVNQSLVEMHGFAEKKELLGQNAFHLMAANERTRALNNMKNTLSCRTAGTAEYILQRRDGSFFPGELTATVLKDTNGTPTGIVATSRDISERKQLEAERRSYRELIDRIVATIPNSVMVVNHYSRIVLANRTFYECFKLDKEHVEGKPMFTVLPIKPLFEMVSDVLTGKSTETFIEFKYTLDGYEHIFIGNVLLTQKEEALVILTDVTIEREKQERLYLTDRLASIGEMSSGVAHELNNPLTSIISLSQLLLEENLSPEEKEDVGVINKEAQRAATIVKNLLSFARKHQPVREPTQINKIIEDVLQLRKYEHKLNNIEICTSFDNKLPETMVDYFQMQQVFLNIVLNAENALNENKQQKPLLDIATKKINGIVRISFKDNGKGIAPEHIRHVFDPFFTTKGVGKGTGLGLSICYGIVSSHGGKIYAQSKPGQGSTFIVELPANGKNKNGKTKSTQQYSYV